MAVNGPGLITARSVSRRVWDWLEQGSTEGQVLAVFRRACLLKLPGDRVVALVLPEIGNGPLNVVVENPDSSPSRDGGCVFAYAKPGMAAGLGSRRLTIGGMEISLGRAGLWEPCPDWDLLRQKRGYIEGRLRRLRAMALQTAPQDSLLVHLSNRRSGQRGLEPPDATRRTGAGAKPPSVGMAAVREALECLEAGWAGDCAALQAGGKLLAGLGGGLTPAGDDFLMGAMLWAWLAHPEYQAFSRRLLGAAAARTTTLSAALLRSAAGGECGVAWHDLLAALAAGSEEQLAEAVTGVLSFGHSSGADALAGFAWMGLASTQAKSSQAAGASKGI